MAGKFMELWEVIEIPAYVLIAWGIVGWLMTVFNILPQGLLSSLVGWVVTLAAFGYIGYTVVQKKGTAGYAAKAGALAGIISGIVGGILGIVSIMFFPQVYTQAIDKAVAQGAPRDMVETSIKIGVYAGIVIAPAISAGIGAGISAISKWILEKIM